ncbi:MAG: DNA polymerase I [Tissierellia bacterium]|nr:DNA polymerase I [Tissierellia bacterium]
MKKDKFLIVDGSSIFFRAFYALPLLTTKEGFYTNAVYGFINMVHNTIKEYEPRYIAICFDMKGPTFRTEEYAEYKGTRQKAPSELLQQLPIIYEILDAMNIKILEKQRFEADDLAGTIADKTDGKNIVNLFLTGDRDYLQLVNENSKVLFTKKGSSVTDIYDIEAIDKEYGLTPKQLIDLKGLMGDSSDNIPGVPGIGIKTGLKLMKEYESIENLYENVDSMKKSKMKENLIENKAQAFMSKRLGTIRTDVPIEFNLSDFELAKFDEDKLIELFKKYEFNSLLKRFELDDSNEKSNLKEIVHNTKYNADSKEIIDLAKKADVVEFKILADGKPYFGYEPLYIGFLIDEKTFVNKLDNYNIEEFAEIFENKNIAKRSFNIKDDILFLKSKAISYNNIDFDPLVSEYLLDPTTNYDIAKLSAKYDISEFDIPNEISKKYKKNNEIAKADPKNISKFLENALYTVSQIYDIQMEEIEKSDMKNLYHDIELPLTEILADMEFIGFKVDTKVLDELGEEFDSKLTELTEAIYKESGKEFNINSPKQLGEVLFDEMKLPVIKKTKTGYSTDMEVLEKLAADHDIANKIIDYRQMSKLKSTYIDGLRNLIADDKKIHSSFNQTITATGRISSTDPNLQNIPIKSEEGRLIRKAFVPCKEEYKLIDADYSQIELRVLASIAKDENMIEAFKTGTDIHKDTAANVFHVPKDEVTPLLRSRAKAVNFGIIYGISDFGLSRNLNIPRQEAKEYIERYLNHFSSIKKYMHDIVELGKEKGYVETLLHRKRYIPELNAKNYNIRQFGERIALNTPIQGTAADIIKIAMINVYRRLKKDTETANLILQVHDELIVECADEEVEKVKNIMIEEMQNALNLKVKLIVDINVGKNWYETK